VDFETPQIAAAARTLPPGIGPRPGASGSLGVIVMMRGIAGTVLSVWPLDGTRYNGRSRQWRLCAVSVRAAGSSDHEPLARLAWLAHVVSSPFQSSLRLHRDRNLPLDKTIRCFPDKFPIGIERSDTSRFVFFYLVNLDFRQFLIRHVDLFRCLHHWTVRLLVPRRFRKAVALYKAAVREELWTPLNPSVSKSLETYFREWQEQGGHLGDPSDRYNAQEFRKQGMPKIHALYRAWRRTGDKVLWQSCSTCLRDDWSYGRSSVEVQPLNRQYLLTGSMDRDVWAKRGAKRKSRQVGPRFRHSLRTLPPPWSRHDSE
jgi:hypothetical protein